ncbi:molybdopterin-dependent oxidoreductase [Roseomonas marmotae]|uniref:Oxidoreductase n=1 Tax=Roseomonas marmotae TaxID=2768161 RepID=A0ABS3KAV7_9PROT|nr:molybdopterin-dependent oxidoreductase [Roseomonas marmotae]MBO1073491.1 oxidoreductase [Roseomonas marmotae]QTI80318.1 oxidoreductase [Roseomonas marmotae]
MVARVSRRLLGILALSQWPVVPSALARGAALAQPKGEVILTIAGHGGLTNRADVAEFDRDMLESLGMTSFTTETPWYDKPVTFEGVPMLKLMAAVSARGTMVTALALDGYETDIPMSDFAEHGTLLALKLDGAYMPADDKGPLFIAYPYDRNTELQTEPFYTRSVWQVARLTVR